MDGIRVASDFTQVPWVKDQFSCKLAIDVYPGTLNLEITDPEDLKAFDSLRPAKEWRSRRSRLPFAVPGATRSSSREKSKGPLFFPVWPTIPGASWNSSPLCTCATASPSRPATSSKWNSSEPALPPFLAQLFSTSVCTWNFLAADRCLNRSFEVSFPMDFRRSSEVLSG